MSGTKRHQPCNHQEGRGRMCIRGRGTSLDKGKGERKLGDFWGMHVCPWTEVRYDKWRKASDRRLDRWTKPDGEKCCMYQFDIMVKPFISLSLLTHAWLSLNTFKWTHLSFPKFISIYQMQISWGMDSVLFTIVPRGKCLARSIYSKSIWITTVFFYFQEAVLVHSQNPAAGKPQPTPSSDSPPVSTFAWEV